MDKNTIKNRLAQRFLSEESTPGIKVTADMRKKSGEINKKGVGAEAKDSIDYNKSLKQDSDTSKMADNKFNYTDEFEETYHGEMEIMNGQEMIQYDRKPNKEFQDKAEEGIAGSSRMGNNSEWANVVDKQPGFEGPDFGKNLVKRIKASEKKRNEQTPTLNLRGRDIQADLKDTGHKPYAFEKSVKENTNNNNPQIKESMKRLKFKKEFNGVGNALKLIPESYKVDAKEFEMTDGNETYRIRWEGTLSEGAAVIITANDKKMVNEDIQRMKALFGYKSQDTLGLVKGNARIDENKVFGDIWNKSKRLLGESEEIEGQTADKTAPFEEAGVKQAAEAKKHVEGSVSTEKGTQAPKPKTGNWEDNVKGQAAEAKKHVEGSVSTEKGTKAPKPKEGEWEEIEGSAPEATEHMESGTSTHKATNKAKVVAPAKAVNENFGEEDDEEGDEGEDSYNKPDADDEGDMDAEPSATDIKPEVPALDAGDDEEDAIKVPAPKAGGASLAFSPSLGVYWIKGPGLPLAGMEVPAELASIAADNSKKGLERANLIIKKLQDMDDTDMDSEEELDEYGDEHPVSTKDAVAGMGAGKENKKARK
jgi:hypothetical protein